MRYRSLIEHILFAVCVVCCVASCGHQQSEQKIPAKFRDFIKESTTRVPYKQLSPNSGSNSISAHDSISSSEALEDIEMLEYLWKTSYSGYEYWKFQGVDFDAYISKLKAWATQYPQLETLEFEAKASAILQEIYDGHISFVGAGYNAAYRHKAVYFTDILIEKMASGEYQVIDSKNKDISIGATFTQTEKNDYLFPTLAPGDRQHFLLGLFSFKPQRSVELAFDNQLYEISLHKSRLLLARFDDLEPYSIDRVNEIPIIRVTSFRNELYPEMQNFMQAGFNLQAEDLIIINLFNNGGGSSVFPQTFLSNLNGPVQWESHWADLTSPAIAEYFYNLELGPTASPGYQSLVANYSRQYEKLRSFPVKSWTFSSTQNEQKPGKFKGKLILMTNRRVLSGGENLVGASSSISDRIVVGENTGGVAQFSSTSAFVLPHSRLVLNLPRQLIFIPGLEECVGYLPDYWLDTDQPLEEVLKWLEAPEKYQFKYTETYAELLKRLNATTVLPADAQVIPPGPEVADSLARFSGKWFGVSDGVLDHLLLVENISASGEVDAIYAWGVAYQWGVRPGWERFKGAFQGNTLVLKAPNRPLTITYEIRRDGSMDSWYIRPGIRSYTELVKRENE